MERQVSSWDNLVDEFDDCHDDEVVDVVAVMAMMMLLQWRRIEE